MPQAQRTAAAQRDLEEIGFQIAVVDGRLEVAEKILQKLVSQCDLLAKCSTTSLLGTAAPEIGEGVRLFSCMRWVILFRYVENGIIVLRFADASQDYLVWKL